MTLIDTDVPFLEAAQAAGNGINTQEAALHYKMTLIEHVAVALDKVTEEVRQTMNVEIGPVIDALENAKASVTGAMRALTPLINRSASGT